MTYWRELYTDDYRMRVLNKKYWPFQHTVSNKADAEKWCYENFKSANWRNVGVTFAFKNGTTLHCLR